MKDSEPLARKRASQEPRPRARVKASGLGEDAGRRERARIEEALASLREKGMLHFYSAPSRLNGLPTYFALLRRCQEIRFEAPSLMVELALMAAVFAQGLDPERYSSAEIADYRCRAAIELGNAYRVADKLKEAEKALGEAATLQDTGTGDSQLKTRLFDVQASLLADRRRFPAACGCLQVVRQIHLANGDLHLAGRTLISQGLYTIYSGAPEKALPLFKQGIQEIDRRRDPDLHFIATHNTAQCMIDMGQYRPARRLLWQNEQEQGNSIGRVSRLKLRWLRARIDAGLGMPERALARFEQIRAEFREEGLPYKEALLTLEMAVLGFRLGRNEDARRQAMESVQVFRSLSIAPETLMAVLLLQNLVEVEVVSPDLLEWILEFLVAAEHDSSVSLVEWMRRLN